MIKTTKFELSLFSKDHPSTPFLRVVQAGEVIVRQGEQGDHFFVIESGQFDVIVEEASQQPALVHTCCTVGTHVGSFGVS